MKEMDGFTIIEYNPAMFDQVNEFWNETNLGGSYRGDSATIVSNTLKAGGHLPILINNDNEVIGTAWLTNDKRRTYIHHFGIKKEYRKRGLATFLLQFCMELANDDGYQVKLEVHKDNAIAVNLYQNFGFKYLGDYEVMIKRESVV